MPNKPNRYPASQVNSGNYNNNAIVIQDNQGSKDVSVDENNCHHNHDDDDTKEDPWPESFDPMKPEKPFLPITRQTQNAKYVIEAEAHSNLIPHTRPQRNQKNFGLYSYQPKRDKSTSRSFKPSHKGPKEFFPSLQGNNILL